jgi:hypothetical protein
MFEHVLFDHSWLPWNMIEMHISQWVRAHPNSRPAINLQEYIDWLTDGQTDWLTNWLIDWLTNWLIDWLADRLIDWLIDVADWFTVIYLSIDWWI